MSQLVSIAVIGSINLDIVAHGAALPRAGETVTGATLGYHPGGKGANQALAARRLGAEVTMIGAVGEDALSTQAMALLRAGGVNLDRVTVAPDVSTGVALIAVGEGGENQIIVAPGANKYVTADVVADLDFGQFDAIICQLELPIATIEAIAMRAPDFFAINLAPAQPVSMTVLQRADLIIVNETEAAFYGVDLHKGQGLVVVTLGAEGAVMYQGGMPIIKAIAPSVSPVDTTGAGDTFVGALVVALMEGQSYQSAMDFACAAGAVATLTGGAQPSLPDRAAVATMLAARP